MAKQTTFYVLLLFIFSSCGGLKLSQHLKDGKAFEDGYITSIPFSYKNDLIVIEVKINNRSYNFMLDTGATSMISTELAEELNFESLEIKKIDDVRDNVQNTNSVKVDIITLGGIDFLNTTAGISDFLSQTFPYSSMKIDGIIGSNLMQNAIWDFDFLNQKIVITDRESKLSIPSSYKESRLYIGHNGIASVTSNINGKRVFNHLIDLGYDGGIVIPLSVFESQIEDGIIDEFIKEIDDSGETKQNKFSKAKIDEIKFGDFVTHDKVAYSDNSTTHRIGLGFLKDYRIILNWSDRNIKIIEDQPIAKD